MGPDYAIDLFRQGIFTAMLIICVLVLPGLITGLLVAMFQAATQINEMSLSFIPKVLITFMILSLTGPWLIQIMINFTQELITRIPGIIG